MVIKTGTKSIAQRFCVRFLLRFRLKLVIESIGRFMLRQQLLHSRHFIFSLCGFSSTDVPFLLVDIQNYLYLFIQRRLNRL